MERVKVPRKNFTRVNVTTTSTVGALRVRLHYIRDERHRRGSFRVDSRSERARDEVRG
jgi:hypothetical protein